MLSDVNRVQEQFLAVTWEADEDVGEQIAAVEQRAQDLREQLDDEVEATQLGMTVEVIAHEFDHSIQEIRQRLKQLHRWGEVNPDLAAIVRQLRTAFEHLDGFLTLFTPLQRRLYRTASTFSGSDLAAYLGRLFGQRLDEAGIELKVTPEFRATEIKGFPSTYYPVLVNLVDNAIWWLKGCPSRVITLHRSAGFLRVADTGPGVDARDRETVFKRGFSMKPRGRGLGLTIARDAMKHIGGNVRVAEVDGGAEFVIQLPPSALVEDEDADR